MANGLSKMADVAECGRASQAEVSGGYALSPGSAPPACPTSPCPSPLCSQERHHLLRPGTQVPQVGLTSRFHCELCPYIRLQWQGLPRAQPASGRWASWGPVPPRILCLPGTHCLGPHPVFPGAQAVEIQDKPFLHPAHRLPLLSVNNASYSQFLRERKRNCPVLRLRSSQGSESTLERAQITQPKLHGGQ